MAKIEFRMHDAKMSSSGDMLVSGYVNETEQLSHELGMAKRFKEKITKGAFKRAINSSKNDIDFLAEHDSSVVLASTKNGTLELREDDVGLYMEARIINTSAGRDWYEMISSGLITNMSFGFRSLKDDWKSMGENLYQRTINELELFEVSAVRNPAYASSSISNRGMDLSDEDIVPDNIEEDKEMEQRTAEELIEAMREFTAAVKEVRGTMGKDKDGKEVNVQKDNYAVGQQTSTQGKEADFKRIKEGEDPGKYAGNKEIDGKGSYNSDKNTPQVNENGEVVNKPESQSGKTKQFDGSHPDDVPGTQNHESAKANTKESSGSGKGASESGRTAEGEAKEKTPRPKAEEGTAQSSESQEGKTDSGTKKQEQYDDFVDDDYTSRSISFSEYKQKMKELRGGY